MSWLPTAPNEWKNDRSNFTIKFDASYGQYVIEDVDGRFTIPIDDIFNNPVFPIDLSNVTVLGKHFRAEAANTPNSPGFSFQGDSNSGFYHISDGKIGFASNGIKRGEFGADYGAFNGNVVQWINDKSQTSKTNTSGAYVDLEKGSGISWEIPITPKLLGSKIVIIFRGSFDISAAGQGTMGVRVNQKLNLGGAYSVIWKPQEINATSPFQPVDAGSGTTTAMYKGDYVVQVYHNPTYAIGDTLYYKFAFSSTTSGSVTNNSTRPGNNGETSVSIMEIAQI
jgi:hypothetical protein